jgi:hypothetical protein
MIDTPPTQKPEPPVEPKALSAAEQYMQQAIEYIRQGNKPPNLSKIGKLHFLKDSEDDQHCQRIRQLLLNYIIGNESQPFSIVVFGPPGSGKSFYVRELVESLAAEKLPETKKEEKNSATAEAPKEHKTFATVLGELLEVNLAQLYTAQDLSKRFYSARQQKKKIKVFFFDEFDSSLDGVSLGWLRWFLAPMQDGKFSYDGQSEEIGKSIFIFAGGTAATFKDFQERTRIDLDAYHEKKVPDFISRLRGFINITGINDPSADRSIRRAFILRNKLEKKFSIEKGELPIGEKSCRKLLSNAHYVHGNRSMEALIEMSNWMKGETFEVDDDHLPPRRLMELHVSRGELDGVRIGISAGLDQSEKDFLVKLSRKLFENGAELAYGGNLGEAGTLRAMVEAAKNTPEDLLKREERHRIRNYLGYPAYQDPILKALNKEVADQVKVFSLNTLSKSECKKLKVPFENHMAGKPEKDYFTARPKKDRGETGYKPEQHLAWSLSLFRMRVRMMQDLTAVITFGGKDDGQSWGRFSGIAEEVMLALAMKKPLYVMGKAGGAGQAVGKLLGLDETLADMDDSLSDVGSIEGSEIYNHFKHAFILPGQSNLPRTVAEVRNYLFEHGVTSSTWPWNGLTPEQNRQLFNTELTQEDDPESNKKSCISLIIGGLMRLDWKSVSGPSENKGMKRAKNAAP